MHPVSPIRKIFQGAPDRRQMFRMFDRHAQRPNRWDADASALYAGEWFEIGALEHDYMLNILPPLWMRPDMFAMREFLTGSVTSVFFALPMGGTIRYFHGYCDLADRQAPPGMRDAILARETRPVKAMTRDERLEHIWSEAGDDYRGYAGPRWPKPVQGHRTVMLYGGKEGTFLKLLDTLSDDEIAAKLPVHLRHLPTVLAA